MGLYIYRDHGGYQGFLNNELQSRYQIILVATAIITFAELADRRCAVSVAWIGFAGGLGGCYGDSELGHSSHWRLYL